MSSTVPAETLAALRDVLEPYFPGLTECELSDLLEVLLEMRKANETGYGEFRGVYQDGKLLKQTRKVQYREAA